jgi:hypothetical protein
MKTILAAMIGLIVSTGLAAAQAPVAVVEDVQGPVSGVEFMDYVAPGKVIKLGQGGTVVLGYIKSCWRETITGVGTVIVGNQDSMVHLGEAKTSKVACDSAHTQLIDRETGGESAATVVRGLDAKNSPRSTVYGLSPVIETTGRGKLVVERLDAKGERYDLALTAASLVRGKFYDFAKAGTALTPGGVYEASQGSRKVVFQVDQSAQSGATPIIGRLVRLQ